jgi:hypothetical protein
MQATIIVARCVHQRPEAKLHPQPTSPRFASSFRSVVGLSKTMKAFPLGFILFGTLFAETVPPLAAALFSLFGRQERVRGVE